MPVNKLPEMSFMQSVKRFINKNGFVFTVRKYKYETERCYISSVGNCKRELIAELNTFDGENFEILNSKLEYSGFTDVNYWIKMIKHFVSDRFPVYLYKVSKEESIANIVN